jgi:hypothetical protein
MARRQAIVVGALLIGLTAPAVARADEGAKAALRDEVSAYFGREKLAARLFLGFGIASVAGGAALISRPDAFTRGAGYTMASIGVLQAVAATAYHFSIDARVAKLHARIAQEPEAFHRDESARVRGVVSRFAIFRYTELALMIAGVGLAAAGEVNGKPLMKGIGLGLGVEAFVFLALDQIAEHSAHRYQEALARIPIHGAFVSPVFAPRAGSTAPVLTGAIVGLRGEL